MNIKKMNSNGFTLIDVLVVLSILGMLAALLIPAIMAARNSSKRFQQRTVVEETKYQPGDILNLVLNGEKVQILTGFNDRYEVRYSDKEGRLETLVLYSFELIEPGIGD